MSSLQEALAVLLGAESEGVREVQEARAEAEEMVKKASERMAHEQEKRLEGARSKARDLLDNARVAADEEARQISELGREERERMERRFREVAPGVVRAAARENVERLLRRGGPAACRLSSLWGKGPPWGPSPTCSTPGC